MLGTAYIQRSELGQLFAQRPNTNRPIFLYITNHLHHERNSAKDDRPSTPTRTTRGIGLCIPSIATTATAWPRCTNSSITALLRRHGARRVRTHGTGTLTIHPGDHVDLPRGVGTHEQSSLAIPRQPNGPEAIHIAAPRDVRITHDVYITRRAVARGCGLAVFEGDDGEFVSHRRGGVPASVEGHPGCGSGVVEQDVEGRRVRVEGADGALAGKWPCHRCRSPNSPMENCSPA